MGSDNCPILVELNGQSMVTNRNTFRFEKSWLYQEGFKNWIIDNWPERRKISILDHWKCQGSILRRKMRGWSLNNQGEIGRKKDTISRQIKQLDAESEIRALSPVEWGDRYRLEGELNQIFILEEIYWQRRGGEKWLLEGDANIAFFHRVANGRKMKSTIRTLEGDNDPIENPEELKAHIYEYYRKLFGAELPPKFCLSQNMWERRGRFSHEDNEELVQPFTLEEIEKALKEMKTNTAPGPDGFPVCFYKEFWPQLKGQIKEMMDLLFEGKLEMWRINYGVITLIPKIRDANTIKAFRPICLLNVCFKLLTKVITNRLSKFADKINESQTAFIPGRQILEGVVILHEVLHELKVKKQSGIILKLDFEKAYYKVQW